MPSKKSRRVAERNRLRNRPVRTRARTAVAKARAALAADPDSPETAEAVKAATVALARAAQKGVIHRNNAARRTSRLMKLRNKAAGAS